MPGHTEPTRSLEDHVLALQEAGRPFSAILEVARAVDQLAARVDDLEAVVPARGAGTVGPARPQGHPAVTDDQGRLL